MKKIENATIFHCEYCTRVSLSAAGMRRHEISCKYNRENSASCTTCAYCEKKEYYIVEGEDKRYTPAEFDIRKMELPMLSISAVHQTYTGLKWHKETSFICSVTNKKMYHNKINRLAKKKRDMIISNCDYQMPQFCDDYCNQNDCDDF